MHISVKDDEKFACPLFVQNPSRVVQFMNMLSPADLFDAEEVFQVKDDLVEEA